MRKHVSPSLAVPVATPQHTARLKLYLIINLNKYTNILQMISRGIWLVVTSPKAKMQYKRRVKNRRDIIESSSEYVDEKKEKSVVSSCDTYEFHEGNLKAITSYNIEIPRVKK